MPLAPWTRLLLPAGLVLLAGAVALFARRQARGRVGGALSRPKQVWLFLALGTWLLAAPLLALDPGVSPPLRALLGLFVGLMLARVPVELVLLYGLGRWTPPMGIAHDLLCAAVMAVGLPVALRSLDGTGPLGPADQAALLLALTVLATLLVEVHHAWAFWRVVGSAGTQGEDAVWFASADDPRFARINRITAWLNAPLLALLGAVLIASLGP